MVVTWNRSEKEIDPESKEPTLHPLDEKDIDTNDTPSLLDYVQLHETFDTVRSVTSPYPPLIDQTSSGPPIQNGKFGTLRGHELSLPLVARRRYKERRSVPSVRNSFVFSRRRLLYGVDVESPKVKGEVELMN